MDFIISIIIISALTCITVIMANKRGRNIFGWGVFALLFSPLIAIILLALLGETKEKRLQRIREEEEMRQFVRNENTRH